MARIRIRFPIKGIDFSDQEVSFETNGKTAEEIRADVDIIHAIHSVVSEKFSQELNNIKYFVPNKSNPWAPLATPASLMENSKMKQLEQSQSQAMVFYQMVLKENPELYKRIMDSINSNPQ